METGKLSPLNVGRLFRYGGSTYLITDRQTQLENHAVVRRMACARDFASLPADEIQRVLQRSSL